MPILTTFGSVSARALMMNAPSVYQVPGSLRVDGGTKFLSWTPGSAGDRKKWTYHARLKLVGPGSDVHLFGAAVNGSNRMSFSMTAGALQIAQITSGSVVLNKILSHSLRDYTGWFDLNVRFDSANATAEDRLIVEINDVRETSFSTNTNISQNADSFINGANLHTVGRRPESAANYGGLYVASMYFLDGILADSSYFNKSYAGFPEKMPKRYAGAFGSNGRFYDFSDATSTTTLGYDRSGNGLNATLNNMTTADFMTDGPVNWGSDTGAGGQVRGNYCTLSPIDRDPNANLVLSNGNLEASYTFSSVNFRYFRGTHRVVGGKWYAEVTSVVGAGVGNNRDMLFSTGTQNLSGNDTITNCVGVQPGTTGSNIVFRTNGVSSSLADNSSLFSPAANGDIMMLAVDFDAGKIWIGTKGVWYNSGDPAAGTNPTATFTSNATDAWAYVGGCGANSGSTNVGNQTVNFGQRPFTYTAPTGFKAICTQNLPTPAIKKPSGYFSVVLDTGANIKGAAEAIFSGSDFLEWIKDRANTNNHQLIDTVRGTSAVLQSNSTGAETTYSAPSGNSVGWVWKRSAAAGLDILTYTGNGSNRTISHNLGVAPKMLIFKNRSSAIHWAVMHGDLGWTSADYVYLSHTGAENPGGANTIVNGAPDSSVINVGTSANSNENGSNIVCFAFAEVPGFSKFGSYTGNGNADGPFVWCGFKPRWIMVKRTDSTADWEIIDTARASYNPRQNGLYSNLTSAENTSTAGIYDFLSSGFKLRGTTYNASGGTYIFAAFAEVPAKYARAA